MKLTDVTKQNIASVLELIYRRGSSSRINIANESQIKPATVTGLVSYLLDEGIIRETGEEVRAIKGSGRSRKLLAINADYAYVIGVEFNKRGLTIAASDICGKVFYHKYLPIKEFDTTAINTIIINEIQTCLSQYPELKCVALGFALPGHLDRETGEIVSNINLWQYFNLNIIQSYLQIPCYADNNIECMALAEYLFSAPTTPNKFLFLNIGPGIFCSFFDNKKIAPKSNYYIGEIGHSVVDPTGQICECGKRGCLQTYISDSWLINTGEYLYDSSPNSIFKSLVANKEDINLDTIISAYRLGDTYITNKIESGLAYLAVSISNTLIIYDAHKVFINSELLSKLGLLHQLEGLIDKQLAFIPEQYKLSVDLELLDFNIYTEARGACALAVYNNIIWNK